MFYNFENTLKLANLSILRSVKVHINPTIAPLSTKPLNVHMEARFSGKTETSDWFEVREWAEKSIAWQNLYKINDDQEEVVL